MKKVVVKEFHEIISDPILLTGSENRIVQHDELPVVNNELSVTLNLKLQIIYPDWACIFHKGTENDIRTPSLWLWPNKTTMHVRFSGNWNCNVGIEETTADLSLNKWHHISYTLSDSEKRLDFYIDGSWVGFHSIEDVRTQKVLFNTGPLHIGSAFTPGFTGEIRLQHPQQLKYPQQAQQPLQFQNPQQIQQAQYPQQQQQLQQAQHPQQQLQQAQHPEPHQQEEEDQPPKSEEIRAYFIYKYQNEIEYSDKYYGLHVILPKEISLHVPRDRLMIEDEWRALGVQQSKGWEHYMIHEKDYYEKYLLPLEKERELQQQTQESNASSSVAV
ncbi:14365_t:CDS:2 [Entrophospora sp. SA101]|nr:14365_t:CDS:2 [Entrophospora sp. SA101]